MLENMGPAGSGRKTFESKLNESADTTGVRANHFIDSILVVDRYYYGQV